MAESVTHRFSEYLRNNAQSNEDMSIPNAIYDVSQDGAQHGKTIETEGYRNQERRSSITSFADLYERAVRNLLNIRPLFESPMDIFGPKSSETNYQAQFSQQSQTRQYKADRGAQNEEREQENGSSEAQNYRFQNTGAAALQSEHLSRGRDRPPNGFFEQVLSEHSRFSYNRQNHTFIQQRQVYAPSHSDRFHPINGQVGPNYSKGQVAANSRTGNGYSQIGFKGAGSSNEISHEQRTYDQHERHWQGNHKHKPSMLDDLRYHARLVLSGELTAPKSEAERKSEHIKQEVPGISPKDTDKGGQDVNAERETTRDTKLSEREQLDLIRERIIKENQKLKYRPYSLRSKRNTQKTEKKQAKRNKIKKKSKIQNLWRPSTPKEIFLYQFGLMRNSKEDGKREIIA